MLKLSSRQLRVLSQPEAEPFVARCTSNAHLPASVRATEALLVDSGATFPEGFRAYLIRGDGQAESAMPPNAFALPAALAYLADGDVVRISPSRGALSVLFRKNSPSNSLLVTERCNHFCVMCSQPPKKTDDSYITNELLRAIPLFD